MMPKSETTDEIRVLALCELGITLQNRDVPIGRFLIHHFPNRRFPICLSYFAVRVGTFASSRRIAIRAR